MRTPSEVVTYRTSSSAIPPPHLIHPHRLLEALRDELPAVGEEEAFPDAQPAHRVRHQDLPTLRLSGDAGCEDDGGAKEVAVLFDRLTRVQADAYGQRLTLTLSEGTLESNGALDSPRHRPERSHEAVASSLQLCAAILLQGIANDRFVLTEHSPTALVAESGHHLGVADEVSEEDGLETRGEPLLSGPRSSMTQEILDG